MGDNKAETDLLIVGAGPTGLSIGAEAVQAGLSVLMVDRGGLCEAIRQYPTDMLFFTTRDLLEIAGIPFSIPEAKPTRTQALAYYREVARQYKIPFASRENVVRVKPKSGHFVVETEGRFGTRARTAGHVALATGYFGKPRRLRFEGEEHPWVHSRYREPCGHFSDRVVVVGGGNSAIEAALELYRWGAHVTLIHRGSEIKPTVKYWLAPDFENRVAEGLIEARLNSTIENIDANGLVTGVGPDGPWSQECDVLYALLGYEPELELAAQLGVTIDSSSGVPTVNPETCESNVRAFYIAGTLQAGFDTGKIFIENSRDHGGKIVRHILDSRTGHGPTDPE